VRFLEPQTDFCLPRMILVLLGCYSFCDLVREGAYRYGSDFSKTLINTGDFVLLCFRADRCGVLSVD